MVVSSDAVADRAAVGVVAVAAVSRSSWPAVTVAPTAPPTPPAISAVAEHGGRRAAESAASGGGRRVGGRGRCLEGLERRSADGVNSGVRVTVSMTPF